MHTESDNIKRETYIADVVGSMPAIDVMANEQGIAQHRHRNCKHLESRCEGSSEIDN